MKKKLPDPDSDVWRADACADLIPAGLYVHHLKLTYVVSSEVKTVTKPKEYGSREMATHTWREYVCWDFVEQKVMTMTNGLMCSGNEFHPITDPAIIKQAEFALYRIANERKRDYEQLKPMLKGEG